MQNISEQLAICLDKLARCMHKLVRCGPSWRPCYAWVRALQRAPTLATDSKDAWGSDLKMLHKIGIAALVPRQYKISATEW